MLGSKLVRFNGILATPELILVLGGESENSYHIAEGYGFKNGFITSLLRTWLEQLLFFLKNRG